MEGLPLVRQWSRPTHAEELAIPPDVPPGLYVLTLEDSGKRDELIVVLTHYTLVLKEAGVGVGSSATHQVTGYARTITGRTPLPGMTVRLYDRSGRLYGQANTDDQGRFEASVAGDTDPLLALGEVEGEITLCGFGSEWNPQGSWWDWWGWRTTPPAGRRFRSYVYTDRPIYRPGQTVQVKAVVRADDDALYSLPPLGTPVTMRLRDARDNVLSTQILSTGAFGTVYTSFTLAEGGTLGTYHVEAMVGEEVTRQAHQVEEYRKPDYQVTVSTERSQYLQGETITVTVEASYYFGRPVVNTPVTLQLYSQIYDPWDCSGEEGTCWAKMDAPLSGLTDAQGRWQAHLPARTVEYYWWNSLVTTFSLEATVKDDSGQSVSSSTVVQVHRVRYGASLFLPRYAFKPGEEIPVELLVRDYQGQPAEGVTLHVGVYRWDGERYRTPVVEAYAVSTAAGRAQASLRVEKQGWYRLAVSGYGEDEAWIWVYDPASSAPWYEDGKAGELQVSADKSSYAVGEVAQLLVRSPVTGTALLTLERGKVRRMELVQLSGPLTRIPLPVEADFAPNVFATVQIYRPVDPKQWDPWRSRPDAVLLIASAELVVPVPERRLQVTITPDRAECAPRDEAVVLLQVTDAAGRPARAELSLAVVDEAIYALAKDLSLDPFEAFYGRRENLVRTYHSLQPTRYVGGGRGGGGDGFNLGNPRRDFPDTAYWNPAIVTDENGRAVVTVRLPDSLTRWRLLARAVTLDTQVGEATASFTVAQPMVVRPGLPRFLVQGDTFTLTASLHNYISAGVEAQAGVDAQGLAVNSPLVHTAVVGSGETAWLQWGVQATILGSATVTTYATAPGLSDAVQYSIPVVPFAVPQVQSWAGEYVGEHVERITIPEGFVPEVTQVEVRLAPSVVPTLLDGLEYLIGYPFG